MVLKRRNVLKGKLQEEKSKIKAVLKPKKSEDVKMITPCGKSHKGFFIYFYSKKGKENSPSLFKKNSEGIINKMEEVEDANKTQGFYKG